MAEPERIVGVLGGMGPLATLDFLHKLIAATPAARCDQEHVPVLACSIPQIPDRTAAFRGQGESPLAAMVAHGRRLKAGGAGLVVMPCNTAHLWFDAVEQALQLPMLHIVDATLEAAAARVGGGAPLGLLATDATVASGLYVNRGARAGTAFAWLQPTAAEMLEAVMPGIAAAKAGRLDDGRERLAAAARALRRRGAQAVVLGCTEIPLVLDEASAGLPVVDATAALAGAAVRWAGGRSGAG